MARPALAMDGYTADKRAARARKRFIARRWEGETAAAFILGE